MGSHEESSDQTSDGSHRSSGSVGNSNCSSSSSTSTSEVRRQSNDQCQPMNYDVIPLHFDLSIDDQMNIFTPVKNTYRRSQLSPFFALELQSLFLFVRHIILATNLAESSITIPDVRYGKWERERQESLLFSFFSNDWLLFEQRNDQWPGDDLFVSAVGLGLESQLWSATRWVNCSLCFDEVLLSFRSSRSMFSREMFSFGPMSSLQILRLLSESCPSAASLSTKSIFRVYYQDRLTTYKYHFSFLVLHFSSLSGVNFISLREHFVISTPFSMFTKSKSSEFSRESDEELRFRLGFRIRTINSFAAVEWNVVGLMNRTSICNGYVKFIFWSMNDVIDWNSWISSSREISISTRSNDEPILSKNKKIFSTWKFVFLSFFWFFQLFVCSDHSDRSFLSSSLHSRADWSRIIVERSVENHSDSKYSSERRYSLS